MHDPLLSAKPTTLRNRLLWGAAAIVVLGAIAFVVVNGKSHKDRKSVV